MGIKESLATTSLYGIAAGALLTLSMSITENYNKTNNINNPKTVEYTKKVGEGITILPSIYLFGYLGTELFKANKRRKSLEKNITETHSN